MTNLSLSPTVEKILEIARWAPSGDNAQPWSFYVQSEDTLELRIHHQSGNVYEYRGGEPTLISAGTLLENIEIASAAFGKKASWEYVGYSNGSDRIEVSFVDQAMSTLPDLFEQISKRSVDRRPYKMRPLRGSDKLDLSNSVDENIVVEWYESLSERRKMASLTKMATDIRLRIPETFEIHNRIVDWDNRQSTSGIPSRSLGLDAVTLRLMRWSLANKSRTDFANFLGSPFFAALQMDVLPGIFSAAYFTFRVANRPIERHAAAVQLLKVGQSVQRFWLVATKAGLALQPCLAVLAFSHYGASAEPFTVLRSAQRAAAELAQRVKGTFADPDNLLFFGRIGWPRSAITSRSIRRPLSQLIDRAR